MLFPYMHRSFLRNLKHIARLAFYFLDDIDGFKREFSVSDTSFVPPLSLHRTRADGRLPGYATRKPSFS
jgi:hypothetical protein